MVRSKLLLKPENLELKHFYSGYIPSFKVNALNIKEMIAEKVCATADRYAPRDYFDLYNIIKLKLPVSISLVRKKFKANNEKFEPGNIFKNTNRIFNAWEEDLLPLTSTKLPFAEVIGVIRGFLIIKLVQGRKRKPASGVSSLVELLWQLSRRGRKPLPAMPEIYALILVFYCLFSDSLREFSKVAGKTRVF